jgi:LuxR family transcriptional regulator, quorum-sensing system regulator SolR
MNRWREDCLNRLTSSTKSIDEIVQKLAPITHKLGFDYCSYVFRSPFPMANPTTVWASTYPDQWLDHYFSHQYIGIDPLLERTSRTLSPVVWADDIFMGQPSFWEEAQAHGIRHGWALTLRGNRMATGMLSLARSHEFVSQAELAKTEAKLVWLSHIVHGLISTVELEKHAPESDQELTAREREVLRWTAAGKTADEIGTILGITERTVTFHVSSSLARLNVVNKTQAVAKALLLGILP